MKKHWRVIHHPTRVIRGDYFFMKSARRSAMRMNWKYRDVMTSNHLWIFEKID